MYWYTYVCMCIYRETETERPVTGPRFVLELQIADMCGRAQVSELVGRLLLFVELS